MARKQGHTSVEGVKGTSAVGVAVVLIAMAAIYRGANRWLPLLVIEWLSLSVLLLLGAAVLFNGAHGDGHPPANKSSKRAWLLILVLSSPFWCAALQLIPWPQGWLVGMSGRAMWGSTPATTISLVPDETWRAALVGLPIIASFSLALAVSSRHLDLLLRVWLATAMVQAVLGLLQLAIPSLSFSVDPLHSSQGSFGSRNSLGNYLAMLLPLTLLLTGEVQGSRGESLHRPAASAGRWLWRGLLLLLLAGLMASMSRGGIASGLFVLMLAWALMPVAVRAKHGQAVPHHRQAWWNRALMLGILLFVLASGGWNWLLRFETGDPLRLLNWASSWNAVQAFWPVGSGLGTFGAVFPAYQHAELGLYFVNFAHNEYLQLLMECGALVIPVALALAWLIGQRTMKLLVALRRDRWSSADGRALACGLGFLAQALHALVDYPWRIPATAMLGAFLLGVFLREPEGVSADRRSA